MALCELWCKPEYHPGPGALCPRGRRPTSGSVFTGGLHMTTDHLGGKDSPASGPERRGDPRFAVNKPFLLRFGDRDKLRRWYVRDISKGGVFVRTKMPRPVGASVQVVIELPDGRSFSLPGKVVHAAEGPRGGNGVRFTDLSAPALAMLDEYIATHVEPGEPTPAPTSQPPVLSLPDLPIVGDGTPAESGAPLEDRVTASEGDDATPPVEAPTRGDLPSFRRYAALLELVGNLSQVEQHLKGSPYELLGLEPTASRKDVHAAHAERLLELEPVGVIGDALPPWVEQRIDRAAEAIDAASDVLTNPATHAVADLELDLIVSAAPEPEFGVAFETEVNKRRAEAPAEMQAEYERAAPFLRSGIAMLAAGDTEAARNMLHTALLYDPYNLEIRVKLAAAMGWTAESETPE